MSQPALSEGGSVSLLDCHSTGDLKYATGVARSNRSVPRDEAQDEAEGEDSPAKVLDKLPATSPPPLPSPFCQQQPLKPATRVVVAVAVLIYYLPGLPCCLVTFLVAWSRR